MRRTIEETIAYIKELLSEDRNSQAYVDRMVEKTLAEITGSGLLQPA